MIILEFSNMAVHIQLMWISVNVVYNPPYDELSFQDGFTDNPVNVLIGDFSSHSFF